MDPVAITVHELRNPFDLRDRVTTVVTGSGHTVGSLAPRWFRADQPTHSAVIAGERVKLSRPIEAGEVVTYKVRPAGIEIFGLSGFWGTAAAIGTLVGLNLISRLLLPRRKQTLAGDERSTTYSFRPLQRNAQAEGAAVPVGYGEHRVAPVLVNRFIRTTTDPAETTLFLLYLVSEGPIESIGQFSSDVDDVTNVEGVEINNQPMYAFEGVRGWIRLGSVQQEPIPGFEDAILQFPVERDLVEPSEKDDFDYTVPAGTYGPSSTEVTNWNQNGSLELYDMNDEADEFTVGITFPSGLYKVGTNGIESKVVEFQVRYVELVGGSPSGDYVYLPVESPVSLAKKSAVSVEFTHKLIDPANFTPGTTKQGIRFNLGSAQYAHTVATGSPSTNIEEQLPDQVEMTMSAWVRPAFTTTGSFLEIANDDVTIIGQQETANKGFRFALRKVGGDVQLPLPNSPDPAPIVSADRVTLRFEGGDGSTLYERNMLGDTAQVTATKAFWARDPLTGVHEWTHVAISYKAEAEGSSGRIRYYVNGALMNDRTLSGSEQPVWDWDKQITVAANNAAGSNAGGIDIQEALIYQRELNPFEVASLYAGGKPTQQQDGEDASLKVGYHMDTILGTTTPTFVSQGQNDLSLKPSGTPPGFTIDNGPVSTPPGGNIKRGTYRIEVQRLTDDDETSLDVSESTWDFIDLRTFQNYSYPGRALFALQVKATGQLSGSDPLVTLMSKLRRVQIWDQVSPSAPTTFEAWSRNPAWVLADHLTNREYGLGAYYSFRDLDLPRFQEFADWCEELVYDMRGRVGQDHGTPLALMTYSAITDQITVTFPTNSYPDWIKVGDKGFLNNLAGTAAALTYNTPAGKGATIVAISPSPPTNFLVFLDASEYTTKPTGSAQQIDLTSGEFFTVEERAQFDGVFDSADEGAWDAAMSIAQTARAVPIRIGSRISIFYDAPRDPVALVTMGNVLQGTFSAGYDSLRDKPNVLLGEFLNRDRNFERNFLPRETDDVQDPSSGESFRRRSVQLRGITRVGQVARFLQRDLNAYQYQDRYASWSQGLDALTYAVGDVVSVAHDVFEVGVSGRLLKDSTSQTRLYLDREAVLASGKTYEVELRNPANGTLKTVAVTSGAGTYAVGTQISVASVGYSPLKGDLYSLGEVGQATEDYAIMDMAIQPDNYTVKVTAIVQDPQVYTDVGEDTLATELFSAESGASDSVAGIPQAPQSLSVEESVERTDSGSLRIGASVSWSYADPQGVAGTAIWVGRKRDGSDAVEVGFAAPSETSWEGFSQQFARRRSVYVFVQPVSTQGLRRGLRLCPSSLLTPLGIVRPLVGPTSLTGRVTGERATYEWAGGDILRAAELELRRGGWVLGQRIATATPKGGRAETQAWASVADNAAGVGVPKTLARYSDGLGAYSEAAAELVLDDSITNTTNPVIYEASEEDSSFTGTKTGLAVVSSVTDARYQPVEDRGPYLEFSGSALNGTYEFSYTLRAPRWVYPQVVTDAVQVFKGTFEDWGLTEITSLEGRRMTCEGPIFTRSEEQGNCTLSVEASWSATSTPGTDYRPFRDGLYWLRSIAFRVSVTRPSTEYQVKLRRVALRVLRRPPTDMDYVASQVFGR